MAESLRNKAISGGIWTMLEKFSVEGIQFVVGIILARTLMPSDFGTISMIMVFIAVSQVFIESGFGSALIQKKDITEEDKSSVFYFNILLALFFAVILVFSAGAIARFYEQAILSSIIKVLAINLLIRSFSIVQISLLNRDINFKLQFKVTLTSKIISGILAISSALLGAGVWALVIQRSSLALLTTINYWFMSKWRPKASFSMSAIKGLFGFGSKIMIQNIVREIFNNLYLLVIGKMFSAADLGYYNRAKRLQRMPVLLITNSVGKISFPVLSKLQNNIPQFKRAFSQSLQLITFVTFPVMIMLFVVAKPLVIFLITDKWLTSVAYLQLLVIVGMLHPWQLLNVQSLNALGHSKVNMYLGFIKNGLRLLNLVVMWRFGVFYIVLGEVLVSFVSLFINSMYSGKYFNFSIFKQLYVSAPSLLIALFSGTLCWVFNLLIGIDNQTILLFSTLIIGFLSYYLVNMLLKPAPYKLFLTVYKDIFEKLKK